MIIVRVNRPIILCIYYHSLLSKIYCCINGVSSVPIKFQRNEPIQNNILYVNKKQKPNGLIDMIKNYLVA